MTMKHWITFLWNALTFQAKLFLYICLCPTRILWIQTKQKAANCKITYSYFLNNFILSFFIQCWMSTIRVQWLGSNRSSPNGTQFAFLLPDRMKWLNAHIAHFLIFKNRNNYTGWNHSEWWVDKFRSISDWIYWLDFFSFF